MKLRCAYCRTVFTKLASPLCPGCGRTLRMAWESDLKSPQTRAVFRSATGRRKDPPPRRRLAAPVKPTALMLPWLVLSYRSRFFMWTLVLAVVIVGRILISDSGTVKILPSPEDDRRTRAGAELKAIRTGLEWFRAHCKRYPTDDEGLKALVRDPGVPGWHGNYLDQLTSDPWGNPYRYGCTNETVSLRAEGIGAANNGRPYSVASPEPDWRELLERIDPRDLPRWETNSVPTAATRRPS